MHNAQTELDPNIENGLSVLQMPNKEDVITRAHCFRERQGLLNLPVQ